MTTIHFSGEDSRVLRDAFGCFATGVTIVTTLDAEGKPVGLTANSFTSVSLDPPLLLVCIANTAQSAASLQTAERFAVNVLHADQHPTSSLFAGRNADRFNGTSWSPGSHGLPIVDDSMGSFECTRETIHDAGDHFILIGRIERAHFDASRDPLLYFRGKYRRLHFD